MIERAGSWVVTALHFVYEVWRYTKNDAMVPEYMKGIWEEYSDHVEHFPVPKEKWHQVLHEGHCSYVPRGEKRFVTPAMIDSTQVCSSTNWRADLAASARAPTYFLLWSELGGFLHELERPEEARPVLEHALELGPPAGLPPDLRKSSVDALRKMLDGEPAPAEIQGPRPGG